MQRQGSKLPSLAQIYEWLLQTEKLLKPLHSLTFTLLHLIYLALRRPGAEGGGGGGGGAGAESGGLSLYSHPSPLFQNPPTCVGLGDCSQDWARERIVVFEKL